MERVDDGGGDKEEEDAGRGFVPFGNLGHPR